MADSENIMEQADEQEREVVEDEGKKRKCSAGRDFLVKVRQFLEKAEELKDLFFLQ